MELDSSCRVCRATVGEPLTPRETIGLFGGIENTVWSGVAKRVGGGDRFAVENKEGAREAEGRS